MAHSIACYRQIFYCKSIHSIDKKKNSSFFASSMFIHVYPSMFFFDNKAAYLRDISQSLCTNLDEKSFICIYFDLVLFILFTHCLIFWNSVQYLAIPIFQWLPILFYHTDCNDDMCFQHHLIMWTRPKMEQTMCSFFLIIYFECGQCGGHVVQATLFFYRMI